MPAAYPVELRKRIVEHYRNNNDSQARVAEIFQVGISTVRNYLKLEDIDELSPKQYTRGPLPTIHGDKLKQLAQWIQEKPDITLKALKKLFKKHCKLTVSISMIGRACDTLGMTRKKKSLFAQEQLRPDVKKKREEFKDMMDGMNGSDLIFIDETGATLNMTTSYARAESGKRVHMPAPFNKGITLSIIGAISASNVEAALYGEWATNGLIFETFIETQLLPTLSTKNIVIMDNVKFHGSEKVKSLIESVGARILFLPPYSPDLNPIEPMWSKLKNVLCSEEPRTLGEFQKSIKGAFQEITKSDLIGWYEHCGYSLY